MRRALHQGVNLLAARSVEPNQYDRAAGKTCELTVDGVDVDPVQFKLSEREARELARWLLEDTGSQYGSTLGVPR